MFTRCRADSRSRPCAIRRHSRPLTLAFLTAVMMSAPWGAPALLANEEEAKQGDDAAAGRGSSTAEIHRRGEYVERTEDASDDAAEQRHDPPLDGGATLVILGENIGWQVWGSDRYLGTIPVRRDSLPVGPILIEIGLPAEDVGWFRPWPVRAVLRPAFEETLRVEPLQRLRLRSMPAGARVQSNGIDLGWTPLNILVPSIGIHNLSFDAAEHDHLSITYEPGGRPDSLLVAAMIPRERRTVRTIPPASSPWITRAQTILPVAAVILGGGGIWARHRADAAYEEYRHTVDRSRMDSSMDRARSYDRLASTCWISAEVCLIGAVTAWVAGSRRDAGPWGGAQTGRIPEEAWVLR